MDVGFVYALGAAITWGLLYAIDQGLLEKISPLNLILTKMILAVVLILPFLFFNNQSPLKVFSLPKETLYLVVFAGALAVIANFFIYSSIKSLDAPTASMVEMSYPFFVVLFTYMIFKTTPNTYFFLGGALIFAGSYVIIRFS